MSSYPFLLKPSPVLLLLLLSFPLLLFFPEASLCTAVSRKDPTLGNSGRSVPHDQADCTVPCADALHNNGTKPTIGLSDSNSIRLLLPVPARVPDRLTMLGHDGPTSLKSETGLSQDTATSVSPLPNHHTVSSRPSNPTEPLKSSVKEGQLDVAPHSNEPLKDATTSVPSSTPPTKSMPHTSSTLPPLSPRANVSGDYLHLSTGLDSAGDSIPVHASKQSSHTTASSFTLSSSQPGSAKTNVSATTPSTNPTRLTLSQNPSPLTAAPPRTTKTTTTTTTNTTVTTTLFSMGVNIPKSPESPSPASAPQPKTSVTLATGAPIELSSNTTSTSSTTTAAASTHTIPAAPAGSIKVPISTALTAHLADTASLLAVLLMGSLFFLVTVALFVTQAMESYRRKDYTQVDYLINGMYTDSGV